MTSRVHTFPTLYGLSTKNVKKVWSCRVEAAGLSGPMGQDSEAHIIITHGLLGGKQQTTTRRVTQGKNVGRANATTPWTQAVAEATSKWQAYQDKKHYRPSLEALSQMATSRSPMLAMKIGRAHV